MRGFRHTFKMVVRIREIKAEPRTELHRSTAQPSSPKSESL
jgi:hypothetical protein